MFFLYEKVLDRPQRTHIAIEDVSINKTVNVLVNSV
jgi:hypothetical protein